MPGHSRPYPETEERRSQAIVAFLRAGMNDPLPTALAVRALADARRSVAAHRARGEPIGNWLAGEIRHSGLKENAATLAVLELAQHRQEISQSYASRHPDRAAVLHELLAVLGE